MCMKANILCMNVRRMCMEVVNVSYDTDYTPILICLLNIPHHTRYIQKKRNADM